MAQIPPALRSACCAELQEVSPVAVRTVGEPGFALFGSDQANLGHEQLDAVAPLTALGPTPRDRVWDGQEHLALGPAMLVSQRVAAPGFAGDLDEVLPIPPQQRGVLLKR